MVEIDNKQQHKGKWNVRKETPFPEKHKVSII